MGGGFNYNGGYSGGSGYGGSYGGGYSYGASNNPLAFVLFLGDLFYTSKREREWFNVHVKCTPSVYTFKSTVRLKSVSGSGTSTVYAGGGKRQGRNGLPFTYPQSGAINTTTFAEPFFMAAESGISSFLELVGIGTNASHFIASAALFIGPLVMGRPRMTATKGGTIIRQSSKKADYLFLNRNDAMNWSRKQLGHNTNKMFDANGKWIGWSNSKGNVYWGKGVGSSTFPHLNYNIGGQKGHLFLQDKITNRGMWYDFINYYKE